MKNTIFVVMLLALLQPSNGFSQVDSLLNALQSKAPSEKVDLMMGYMRTTFPSDADQAIEVGNIALDLAIKMNNDTIVAKVLYAQGYICWSTSRHKEAITYLDRAYQLSKRKEFTE